MSDNCIVTIVKCRAHDSLVRLQVSADEPAVSAANLHNLLLFCKIDEHSDADYLFTQSDHALSRNRRLL